MIKTAKDIEDMTKSELLEHLNDTVKPEVGEIPAYVLADPKVYDLEHKKSL